MEIVNKHRVSAKRQRENFNPVPQIERLLIRRDSDFTPLIIDLIDKTDVKFLNETHRDDGYNCLNLAIRHHNKDALSVLLDKGVELNKPTRSRAFTNMMTPLLNAIKTEIADHYFSFEMVQMLVTFGADVNSLVGDMEPLRYAMQCSTSIFDGHSIKLLEILLKAGAKTNFLSPYNPNVFFQARRISNTPEVLWKLINLFLSYGADLNERDSNDNHFMWYISQPELRLLDLIIFKGWKFTDDNQQGRDFISLRSQKGEDDSAIRFMLTEKAKFYQN